MVCNDANHWFWKINANAIDMINQRICMKKNNPHFSNIIFNKNPLELKSALEDYISHIKNEIKIQTRFAKQWSRRSLHIRKLTSLENKK